MARVGVCAVACAEVGTFMVGEGRLCGGIIAEGVFCTECLTQMSAVRGTLISVSLQNFSQIVQSAAEL